MTVALMESEVEGAERPPSSSRQAEYVRRTVRKRKAIVWAWKARHGCARCPESDPATLDLHHVEENTKTWKLTKRRDGSRHLKSRWCELSFAELFAEFAKCEVLCANCHRKNNSDEWHSHWTEEQAEAWLDEFIVRQGG